MDMKNAMTESQKKSISRVFAEKHITFHMLADKVGLEYRPDKFEDLTYNQARKMVNWINANISSL